MDLPLASEEVGEEAVLLHRPERQSVPVVFASPHSGRDYPAAFLAAARLDLLRLRRSEDGFVDELFAAAPALGAPLLTARFPRAYCDVNREAWELDPTMFRDSLPPWANTRSPRVGAGLGMMARVVASGEAIYRHRLPFAAAERRGRECWQPYHAALAALIESTRRRFGACLVVDCHSMPAGSMAARERADFVLGDGHGTTCDGRVVRLVEQVLQGLGYGTRRNDPYAGGFITRHYGRPERGVHVLQIEICRSLYMHETRIERLAGFARLQQDVTALIAALAPRVAGAIG
jgi:N-formylglutamate deformylase